MKDITLLQAMPIVVLAALLCLALIVLYTAQQRQDFDIATMLKDDSGKESALRLGVLVSLAISSWGVVYMVMNDKDASQLWFAYLATWSGSMVFIKIVDKWNGQMPWSK